MRIALRTLFVTLSIGAFTGLAHADSLTLTANPTQIPADGKSTSAITITANISVISVGTATWKNNIFLSVSGPGTVSPSFVRITIPTGSSSGSASATLTSTRRAGTVTVTGNGGGLTGSVQVTTNPKGHQ